MYCIKGYISYYHNGKLLNEIFELRNDIESDVLRIISSIEETILGNRIKVTIVPKSEIVLKECYLSVNIDFSDYKSVFLNGFQSWSESREFLLRDRINKLNPIIHGILKNYGGNNLMAPTNKRGDYHSFTYSYIRKSRYDINFWGSLDETKGYTIFKFNTNKNTLKIIKDCPNLTINSNYNVFDILTSVGKEEEIFHAYFGLINIKSPRGEHSTGWTSWYNYYNKIDEEIILNNLKEFTDRNIKIDIFQIDDGYEKAVGDWLETNPKFKNGMKPIADEIKKSGYKAGLWLAPFICEKNSDVYREHPEWILRYENGKKVRAGFNGLWSYNFYALDIYNLEFRAYLKQVFDKVFNNWDFDIVKLDFLYAAGILSTKYKTRAEVMHDGMKLLRELAGDKIILGCGVPLGVSFGIVEYCRIGSDINPKWEDKLLKFLNAQERVSTLSAIDSTISRRQMNAKAFYNDPDVFILRRDKHNLTDSQKRSLYIINLIFGGLGFYFRQYWRILRI